MMTVIELYRLFLTELKGIYDKQEAAEISSIIFESTGSISRAELIKDPQKILDDKTVEALKKSLNKLKKYIPVQYVTGEAWFYKMKFKVSPSVLIPRPETEELVEQAISFLKNKDGSVIDIGTGSGCIAIAIKKNIPSANITAIDINEKALEIARENALLQNTAIEFLQMNFLDEAEWKSAREFDVIISNPPYIPEAEKATMAKHVTDHEPTIALFIADEKPLIFYEYIIRFAKTHLKEKGKIFTETHEDFAKEVDDLFKKNSYSTIIRKDMSGKQRMVIATHCR